MPRIRLVISALTLILLSVLLASWFYRSDSPSLPSLTGDEAIKNLKQQGLYDSLEQAVAATRYNVSPENGSNDSQAAYRAPNPAQGFDALFTPNGISIQPRLASDQTAQTARWQTALSLTGYGYKNDFVALSAPALEARDNRVELRYESVDGTGRGVTEWYVNRAEGLEQGFVIHAQPESKLAGERLRVAMKMSGDLIAEMTGDGQAISFRTQTGAEALRYEKLYVTDTSGRKLAAQMRIESDELRLEIDDDEAAYPITIDPTFTQQAKLLASDGSPFDLFGGSVAIDGETAIVGALFEDHGIGQDAGAAYVFVRTGTTWTQQAKLTASDGAQGHLFGTSVAIRGEKVVVGASQDGPGISQQGAAYLFVRTGTTWTQQAKLTASDSVSGDGFGRAVAIEGETIAVSAPNKNSIFFREGAVYIFVLIGTTWTQQARLIPNDAVAQFHFGDSLSICGETLAVGAQFGDSSPGGDTGAAYIFVRTGTTWTQQAKLASVELETGDRFGNISLSGETVVVGAQNHDTSAGDDAGAAYVFVRTGTTWTQQAKLTASDGEPDSLFGWSVGISGETIIVGARCDTSAGDRAGAAYVFVRTGTTWTQQAKLTPNDGHPVQVFSFAVAISGENVIISARNDTTLGTQAGAAYIFACGNLTPWTEQSHVFAAPNAGTSNNFGTIVAISGETAIVGFATDGSGPAGSGAGSAYVFVRNGTSWTQQAKLTANDADDDDFFGETVAIDGETAVIGATPDETPGGTDAGAAYVFVRTGTTWTQQAKLTASDAAPFDHFSSSVAISGDSIVVGAGSDDTSAGVNAGSAYVFARIGTLWTEQAHLFASDGEAGDSFGKSVAISGNTVVVGAFADDTSVASTAGSAYVFVRAGMDWTEQAHLFATDGVQFSNFGFSVSISGETALIGAFGDNTSNGTSSGSAYVFVRTGTTWAQQAKLTASDGAMDDFFGLSVSISGEIAAIGAGHDNTTAGVDAGSAYVFVRTGTTWAQQAKLTASDTADRDFFGSSVAISGKTIAIGSPQDDTSRGPDTGSAYIFNSTCISVPTAVGLSSLTVTAYDDGVSIEWSTGFEVSNLGFNLYRDHGGKRSAVNPSLIAGSALLVGASTRLAAGNSYSWWDSSPANLKQTLYWLEAVDLDGSTEWFGPLSVKFVGGSAPDRSRAALLARRGQPQSGITAPLTRSATPLTSTQHRLAGDGDPALLPTVKIAVKTEGFYRISQPELLQAGLDPKVDPRFLQLLVDGQPLPISITGEQDGRFDPGDVVEFYGVGLDTASTDTRVYWLTTGAQFGLRINTVDVRGVPTISSSFPYTVARRDRTIYFSSLINGERENFFGPIVSSAAVDQSLELRHVAASSPEQAVLEVALQGVTRTPHNVQVSLNGANVGAVVFNDQAATVAKLNVPHSLLKEGVNQITLIAAGGPSDVSLVDFVRVTYGHYFTAENNRLRLTAQTGRQVTIDGFTNDRIRLLDVTDISQVKEMRASIKRAKNGYSISATPAGEGERTLVAFTAEQARSAASVTANQASRLREASNGADLLIITRPQFASSLARLIALRQSQGLAVALVDVEDIYDEFSFGQKSAQAIKEFLTYARTSWKRKPTFVLFGGDASLDPRNYLGLGDWDVVSSKLIDTRQMETASDDSLCDTDDDGLADFASGRLPFRTIDEAARMVSKIIRYETGASSESILIASDSTDGYSFEAASEQLKSLIPSHIRVEEVRRGELGDTTAKSRLIEAINRGQKIVNYTGHGSVEMWRGGLLTSADIVKLNNEDRLPLFVTMTCLNGYFQDASLDSLAEMLLKAERGGAAAVWASTGMTSPEGQAAINQELYRLIFATGGQPMRIGEAARRAKAATGDSDVRRSWILFGDPTMRLK